MSASGRSVVRRTGRVLTGVGALVVLCALVAGAPVALFAFAGNPLPDHLPTLAEVGTVLTSRDDGQLFLRAWRWPVGSAGPRSPSPWWSSWVRRFCAGRRRSCRG